MPPIISVNDLTHIYSAGTPFEHVAVDHVNFSAEPGELIGVIGHTGSGKSTLIQHLNALLKPTSGTVTFRGEDVWKDKKTTHAIRGKVGLVFQYPEYQLFEESCFKDIAFGPKNQGVTGAELERRVYRAASFVRGSSRWTGVLPGKYWPNVMSFSMLRSLPSVRSGQRWPGGPYRRRPGAKSRPHAGG